MNYIKKSGWCEKAELCLLSHNLDQILDRDDGKINSRESSPESKKEKVDLNESHPLSSKISKFQINSHNAGFDAFMCGYSLLIFFNAYNTDCDEEDWFGKLSLPGYDIPLVMAQSSHYKNSSTFLSFFSDLLALGK